MNKTKAQASVVGLFCIRSLNDSQSVKMLQKLLNAHNFNWIQYSLLFFFFLPMKTLFIC